MKVEKIMTVDVKFCTENDNLILEGTLLRRERRSNGSTTLRKRSR